MTKREAIKTARTLTSSITADRLRLGRILCLIRRKGWFDPYSGILEWSDIELGLPARTCCALTRIAAVADEFGIPDHRVAEVGWTKFHQVSFAMDEDNWPQMMQLARQHSSRELSILLGRTPRFSKTFQGIDQPTLDTIDKAVGQAKAMFGAQTESEAIGAICETFLRAM